MAWGIIPGYAIAAKTGTPTERGGLPGHERALQVRL